MGARLGIGDLSRMRLPFESRFSQYTRTTFCSSLAATSAVLTDCELKFQNISDCLRRLIAPLLLRGIFFLSPGLSFSLADSLRMYGLSHRRRAGKEREGEKDDDPLFLVSDDSSERFRAESGTYISAAG